LKDRNVKSLLMVDDDRLDYSTMKRIIDDLPGECTVASELDNELFREKAFSCDASITYCDLGIEESGSLVVFHRPGAPRLASIAPKVHVAVVHAGSIISNIGGLVTRLTGNTLPSACTIISGVSRTADINLNVTLGMHGPMDMAVVIIGGMKE
ncbi:MAG: LutC/YkgG family protein, partial [Chitinophagales bacterium]